MSLSESIKQPNWLDGEEDRAHGEWEAMHSCGGGEGAWVTSWGPQREETLRESGSRAANSNSRLAVIIGGVQWQFLLTSRVEFGGGRLGEKLPKSGVLPWKLVYVSNRRLLIKAALLYSILYALKLEQSRACFLKRPACFLELFFRDCQFVHGAELGMCDSTVCYLLGDD